MSIDTVTLFFALLAVALQVALVVICIGVFITSCWNDSPTENRGPAIPPIRVH